ncbi:hypothetical protein [Plenodomus lingam JN3]|uniref:C2H2-type domain-containing protein n=1 Tax=Leptosphaeria maculans (strain JN3 / isolate v23.1.3 / race Av1-4-5-6-7-8) TaxID=985895 RepID=M1Z7P9_LEPMJ|nr:hypothetical protein [Plenodomus lingam JN3]
MASSPRIFPCNTCSITFTSSELQRSHMRQSWQRRVAELPAISEEEYDSQAESQEPTCRLWDRTEPRTTLSSSRMTPLEDDPTSIHIPTAQESDRTEVAVIQCLFCPHTSASLYKNIDHMSIDHGLFIPSPDRLYDLESFLGYLATIIFEYNECLYCGLAKGTVDGVQTHMRDKGHCMLNLHPDSELLDFWETGDEQAEDEEECQIKSAAIKLSGTEMRLPSGAVVNSRFDTLQLRIKPGLAHSRTRASQYRDRRAAVVQAIMAGDEKEERADQPATQSASPNDRRIAVRGEMGLTGISEHQRRALQVTELKMKTREAIAKTAGRHAMEQQPVRTKYYKTENPVYQAG